MKIKRALISVWDKTDIVELALFLNDKGIEIIASGGTAEELANAGLEITEVSDFTGCPEMLDGRVKTLHPSIHGGILRKRDVPCTCDAEKNLKDIDLVIVNLYPFRKMADASLNEADLIEYIDIGGPTLLRAAAKNYRFVVVLSSISQYHDFMENLENDKIEIDYRKKLASKAFEITANYDLEIMSFLSGVKSLELVPQFGEISLDLKYGENPSQSAILYRNISSSLEIEKISEAQLSYNNYLDIESALLLLSELEEPACVIVKHGNPCGVGMGSNITEAFWKARDTDIQAWFGGIIAVNREIDNSFADELKGKFVEVIIASSFNEEALSRLRKRSNRRIFRYNPSSFKQHAIIRSTNLGILSQSPMITKPVRWEAVTKRKPGEEEMAAMKFAWKIVPYVKSNAIVITSDDRTFGIGAGQMSRIDSTLIAISKKNGMERTDKALALASDGLFPFTDSIEEAAKEGIKAIVQPGGSKNDFEVIKKADDLGVTMIFTEQRVFRH